MANTADIVGVGAIIIVRGKNVPEATVNVAKKMRIPLAVTDLLQVPTPLQGTLRTAPGTKHV